MLLVSIVLAAPLLNEAETGFDSQTRSDNYDTLLNALYANDHVVTTIGDKAWVPWFKTSSSCELTDLQNGNNCNSGQSIDFTHNCMVTDEFSQVGILAAMGKDQQKMDQFYNTVRAIKSSYGNIPSWRVYRNGDTLEACKQGINGNCDTASDGTARIIIALFTASKNSYFTDTAQKENYAVLAKNLADDMLTYEVEKTCRPTNFGTVCNWLAGGANVKNAGISSTDFAYTGYYPDAIIAMLEAFANTNDTKYSTAAKDFTLNYLQAAKFNGQSFTVPPGKSFRWNINAAGIPQAECTNTCNPVIWDGYDASRALALCQANYYAKQVNVVLPYLQKYCDLLSQKHMTNPNSAPLQFYPDGSAANYQSGYFVQGLQALHQSGGNPSLFKSTLDSALAHYTPATKTFDNAACFGVYTQSFAVRALGMGIGRDIPAFVLANLNRTLPLINDTVPVIPPPVVPPPIVPPILNIGNLQSSCTYSSNLPCITTSDITDGKCRTLVWSIGSGNIVMFACLKNDNYIELYQRTAPTGIPYQACLANGCISNSNGFARFIPIMNSTLNNTINETNTTNSTNSTPPDTSNPPVEGIASLSYSCVYDANTCNKKNDVTSGTCRTIVFDTPQGDVQILGCEKSGGYVEVYRQVYPVGLNFKACIESGCVDSISGFGRFQMAS
ncbi:hypothetical protein C4573_01675 [Candidatus Woesearchaeota archaeon]|nr:MAG: hypothetical protein C4573_01675 [Candidatus Woesearchaeota archaeon]